MSQLQRVRPRLAATMLFGSTLLIAACQGTTTPSSAPGSVGVAPTTPAMSEAPSLAPATEAPSPLAIMPLGFLPRAEVPEDVEVSCEDATGASLTCDDAVALAARIAVTMVGGSPVEQVLVERDAANPNVVTLTLWAVDPEAPDDPAVAFTTTIDTEAQTLTFPQQNDEAVFPG